MLLVKTRHYKCIGGQSRGEAGVRQSRIRELDVDERWIAEREIEWFDGWLVQEREHIRLDDRRTIRELGRRNVLPQRRDRLLAALDEGRVYRAAGERLDAERSSAREQIEDARPWQLRFEDREERLADPVGRGTSRPAAWHHERPPLRLPCDDPHARA